MAGILYIKWLEHKAIQRRDEKTDAEIRRERFKNDENSVVQRLQRSNDN